MPKMTKFPSYAKPLVCTKGTLFSLKMRYLQIWLITFVIVLSPEILHRISLNTKYCTGKVRRKKIYTGVGICRKFL